MTKIFMAEKNRIKSIFKLLSLLCIWTLCSCKEIQVRNLAKISVDLTLKELADASISSNVDSDIDLALNAFAKAFSNASDHQLIQNFGSSKDVKAFYRKLLFEDDVVPFKQGKLKWIRAFVQNQLVGFMTLEPDYQGTKSVYVSTLVVDPAFQNKGIGKAMLNSINQTWFPNTPEIILIVRKINEQAIGFYTRLGFTPAPDIRLPYLGPSDNCMWMRWKSQQT